jgi:hypothetical protein
MRALTERHMSLSVIEPFDPTRQIGAPGPVGSARFKREHSR